MNGLQLTSNKSRQLLGSLAATIKPTLNAEMTVKQQRRSFVDSNNENNGTSSQPVTMQASNSYANIPQPHIKFPPSSSSSTTSVYSKIHNNNSNNLNNESNTETKIRMLSNTKDTKFSAGTSDQSFKTPPDYFTKKKLLNSNKPPSTLSSNRSEIKLNYPNTPAGALGVGQNIGSVSSNEKKVIASPLINSSHPRTNVNSVLLPKLEMTSPQQQQQQAGIRNSFDEFGQNSKPLKNSPAGMGANQMTKSALFNRPSHATQGYSPPSSEDLSMQSPEISSSSSLRKQVRQSASSAVTSPNQQGSNDNTTPTMTSTGMAANYFIQSKTNLKASPRYNLVKYTQNGAAATAASGASTASGATTGTTNIQKSPNMQSSNTQHPLMTPTEDAKKQSYPTKLIRPLVTPEKQENSLNMTSTNNNNNNNNNNSQSASELNQIKSFEVRLKNIKEIADPSIKERQKPESNTSSPYTTINNTNSPYVSTKQSPALSSGRQSPPSSHFSSTQQGQNNQNNGNNNNNNNNKRKIRLPVANAHMKTKAGQYTSYMRKENQDANILVQNFMGDQTCHLYGVYDGHGENGALASGFVKKALQKNLTKEIKASGGLESESLDLPSCLRRAYVSTNKELLAQNNFDVSMSGCTAVTVLTFRSEVYCANTGDSRAMIARHTNQGEWKQVELSRDHKPESPEEKARIVAAGGRVQQSLNENGQGVGIYRVWKKNQDLPGLAMTRSMGDTVGRECGVIADPEIIKHTLTEEDKIMVVASDGVWEFLTNSDVTRILSPYYKEGKIKEGADLLVNRSHREWLKEGESVDDITCVLLFFNDFKEAII